MANKFADMFVAGALKVPDRITKRETFRAAKSFSAPKSLNLEGYCTPVENQGNLPYCAAYSASSFAENILWRRNHYHKDIDPVPLYKYAKTIDGDPTGAGTFLECTMEALLKYGYFDEKICKIQQFGGLISFDNNNMLNDIKYAIHRYGVCMAGFNITTEWYKPKDNIIRANGRYFGEGGHAVIICGYDQDRIRIMNSWGTDYAENGFVWITNEAAMKQFIYATTMTHVLDD
jgi:C1A family cysteine protease